MMINKEGTMRIFSKLSIIVATTVFACSANAQVCVGNIPSTSPTAQFTVNADGTAVDNLTGLMWMRCSIGQAWDATNNTCTGGTEQLTWQQALLVAADYQYAGFDDWQLPNVKELSSLVERQCVDAAINNVVFPATLAQNYWTNTSGVGSITQAWAVAFYSGKTNLRSKTSDVHLRLMRYAK